MAKITVEEAFRFFKIPQAGFNSVSVGQLPRVLTIFGRTPNGRRVSIDLPTHRIPKMEPGSMITIGRYGFADLPICADNDSRYPVIALILEATQKGYSLYYGDICDKAGVEWRNELLISPPTPIDTRNKRIMTESEMRRYINARRKYSPTEFGYTVSLFPIDQAPAVIRFYGSYDGVPCNIDIPLEEAGIIEDLKKLPIGELYLFGRCEANFIICYQNDWSYPDIPGFIQRTAKNSYCLVDTYNRPEYLGCEALAYINRGYLCSYPGPQENGKSPKQASRW